MAKVTQSMDLAQAVQTIRWLDEERRKDKAAIAALQEQLRHQEQELAQQATLLQDLQTKTAGIQSLISQVTGFEQIVSNYKAELVYLIDQREDTRKKEMVEAARLRKMEFESISEHLSKLDKALQVLPRYDEGLQARQAEDQRLSEAIQRVEVVVKDLDKRSDDRVQAVTYLEEQRRADNRRIAALEHDTAELRKRIEVVAAKMPLLEEMVQKQQPRIDEALQEVKKYEKPIEELRVSDFQREQKVKQYLDQGELVAAELERVRTQTQGFIEQQQSVKRSLDKLETFEGRIEKRQNEVAEMQRLAEDRVKRQWEEWQAERVKEKKKQDILIQERWKQQVQTNTTFTTRIDAIQPVVELHRTQIDALWEARRTGAIRALKATQDEHALLLAQADENLGILHGEK